MAPGSDKIWNNAGKRGENRRNAAQTYRISGLPVLHSLPPLAGTKPPHAGWLAVGLRQQGSQGIMSIVSQTVLDSLFAGYFNQERTVPNEAELQEMASRCGVSVDDIKDAFAEKWRAAGNLDDPFGRDPEDEDEEEDDA
jgi:hypothetical protein